MKFLPLLLLFSCVSIPENQSCQLIEVETIGQLIATKYECGDYKKICHRDGENNRSLGCYVTRLR